MCTGTREKHTRIAEQLAELAETSVRQTQKVAKQNSGKGHLAVRCVGSTLACAEIPDSLGQEATRIC